MAMEFAGSIGNAGASLTSRSPVSVVEGETLLGADGLPTAHIIDLEYEGRYSWVLVSGDKRVSPLLAYGHDARQDPSMVDEGGVADFFSATADHLTAVRSGEDAGGDPADYSTLMQNVCIGVRGECPPPNSGGGGGCSPSDQTWGPLLQTTWGQRCPYNANVSMDGCLWCDGHGAPPVGCVATAGAQLVRYHERPFGYRYDRMLNQYSRWNSSHIARAQEPGNVASLFAAIGSELDMDYACDGSGAQTEDLIDFFRDVGYRYPGTYRNWSSTALRINIMAG